MATHCFFFWPSSFIPGDLNWPREVPATSHGHPSLHYGPVIRHGLFEGWLGTCYIAGPLSLVRFVWWGSPATQGKTCIGGCTLCIAQLDVCAKVPLLVPSDKDPRQHAFPACPKHLLGHERRLLRGCKRVPLSQGPTLPEFAREEAVTGCPTVNGYCPSGRRRTCSPLCRAFPPDPSS